MRCIHCQTDADYRARTAQRGRCKGCGRAFAFEPKTDPHKISDPGFQAVVKAVSTEGRLFFTERQLWYAFNQRLRRKGKTNPLGCALPIAFILIVFLTAISENLVLGLTVGIPIGIGLFVFLYARNTSVGAPKVHLTAFRANYLDRWTEIHGPLEKLLPANLRQTNGNTAPRQQEPDLTAYSFDRVLVTDQDQLAAMLVANNFHLENRCAILSWQGYPVDIFDTVLEMLRRNPTLKVFTLHNASVDGFKLPPALRQKDWFPEPEVVIVDLGLRPQSVQKSQLFTLSGSPIRLPEGMRGQLTAEEIKWLEQGNLAEVANLRPLQVMRAVSRGLSLATQMFAADSMPGLVGETAAAALFLATDPFDFERVKKEERAGGGSGMMMYSDFG